MGRTRYDTVNTDACEVYQCILPQHGTVDVPVYKGGFDDLPENVQRFVAENVQLCEPKGIYICDGTQEEADELTAKLVQKGMISKLKKYENWYTVVYTDEDFKDQSRSQNKEYRFHVRQRYDVELGKPREG